MKLIINGEEKTFTQEKINISDLLTIESVDQPDMVSIQLNEEFLRKPDYATTWLKEGDVVDFLYFMGGGQ
ncbi:MAG: sulfur carrier protein ThiS [Burkholderiales bacterium]|jgi:sulfur carrier protein|nr:sulfur carrier protein ThiS [Burkholderiales bacterium]